MTTAKICGLNDAVTMSAALDGGASHVGLVFYEKSPRSIKAFDAAALCMLARDRAMRVGLFVNPTDDFLDIILNDVELDLIQLHGSESPDRVAKIASRTEKSVMKVIPVAEERDVKYAESYFEVADWLLFDAKPPDTLEGALPGGNAITFDWELLSGKVWPLPWMLAGGLSAKNVADAIRITRAPVVDTSSGTEDNPGFKNPHKIRRFLKEVENCK
tara:strand:- start:127 stop:774 length:648 start_codon:yes stop_codon:yes gene_type:complete